MGRIKLEQVKPNQLTKLRDINQKLFPILSISDSSDEFSDIFTDEDRGFAFIAYYSDMTVMSQQQLGKWEIKTLMCHVSGGSSLLRAGG